MIISIIFALLFLVSSVSAELLCGAYYPGNNKIICWDIKVDFYKNEGTTHFNAKQIGQVFIYEGDDLLFKGPYTDNGNGDYSFIGDKPYIWVWHNQKLEEGEFVKSKCIQKFIKGELQFDKGNDC